MEMKKLPSGNLRAVGYDERSRTLRVELSGGLVNSSTEYTIRHFATSTADQFPAASLTRA